MSDRILSGAEGAAAQRWSLPDVAGPVSNGRPRTAREVEDLQKVAYDEAYAQGLAEGRAAARAEAEQRARQWAALLDKLTHPLEKLDQEVETELVELATVIARQLVRREFRIEPSHVVGVVREAVAALPVAHRDVKVHLNPADSELVRELLGAAADSDWTLVDDPGLQRGDCLVTTPSSRVDARLEQRLGAIVAQMLGGEREADGGERGE